MLGHVRFPGEWRLYQRQALAAFEADLAADDTRTHLVAPPGSGKTLLGAELVRRRDRPALVLCPNSAIQSQWLRTLHSWGATEAEVSAEPAAPVCVLTYQSLCQLRDPGDTLGTLAEHRWVTEKVSATGLTAAQVRAEAASYTGAAMTRRGRELARITAGLKREIARGDNLSADVLSLLSAPARERIEMLAARGPGQTIVLDECHHLASMWGYVVRETLLSLEKPHVIGLTATAPEELTGDEGELYRALLGPIDFIVPTPAVVRDGHLAPYQELCHLSVPLDSELDWLREHDARFAELVTALHEDVSSDLSFPGWVIGRMRGRTRSESEAAGISFADFQRRHPDLARAGIRFLSSAGLELPAGAPRGEAFLQSPDLDDWIVLLEDYALRRLATDPGEEAAGRYDRIGRALRDLGLNLTRAGVRRGADAADRVLAASKAKVHATAEIVEAETSVRGDDLRCLVLTDAELERDADAELGRVLDPAAGSARGLLRAFADEPACAVLRPLLVTGRGLRCLPADAAVLAEEVGATAREEAGLAVLERPGWASRDWVAAATVAFSNGMTRLLIGTRGLLGEGWNCPRVNCLVDLTSVAANVSARQLRGRSLRLDPDDPAKLASNWDVVCVAPGLTRGGSDYARFVRRHLHLHAPCEDGSIEIGPSHVHPALSPFHPPADDELRDITRACLARAADHGTARDRWRIGEPYRGVKARTLTVRSRSGRRHPATMPGRPPDYSLSQKLPLSLGGLAVALGGAGAFTVEPGLGAAALAAVPAGWWAARRVESKRPLYDAVAPLELVAKALVEAYRELGEISAATAGSLVAEPRPGGYLRMRLTEADETESGLFAVGLDTLLTPAATPRYLLSRPVAYSDDSRLASLGRLLTARPALRTWTAWHPVPDDLGRHKSRAEVLHRHWQHWIAPAGELVFSTRSDRGRQALAEAQAQDSDFQLQLRAVWT